MQIPAVGRTWRQRRSASIEPPSFFATAATRSSQNECSNAIPMLALGAVRSLDESRKVPHGRKLRLRLNFAQAQPLGALTLITCCSKKTQTGILSINSDDISQVLAHPAALFFTSIQFRWFSTPDPLLSCPAFRATSHLWFH